MFSNCSSFFEIFHWVSKGFQILTLEFPSSPGVFSREGLTPTPNMAFRGEETETSPGDAPRGPELGQCLRNLRRLHGSLCLGLKMSLWSFHFIYFSTSRNTCSCDTGVLNVIQKNVISEPGVLKCDHYSSHSPVM